MRNIFIALFACFMMTMIGCGGEEKETPKKVDKDRLLPLKLELSKGLTDSGISLVGFTDSKRDFIDEQAIAVTLQSKEPFKSSLIAKALKDDGKEMGAAQSTLDLGKDDKKDVIFKFDLGHFDFMVDKIIIDIE